MKLLKDILTSDRNSSVYDLTRVITLLGAFLGCGLQVYAIYKGQPFDFQAYGLGLGLIIGAGAAGMWARKDIEHE